MLYLCDQCGNKVEFDTIVDNLCPQCREQSNEIKPRGCLHKTAYFAFIVLGLISLWASYLAFSEIQAAGGDTSGLAGVLGIGVLVIFGIPLILAVIFGPFLSLFTGWGDGYLISMTGLSYLLLFISPLASATVMVSSLLAYGIACLVICVIGITKKTE
jgi:hypothetical protein